MITEEDFQREGKKWIHFTQEEFNQILKNQKAFDELFAFWDSDYFKSIGTGAKFDAEFIQKKIGAILSGNGK